MDRTIVYTGAIPQDADILNTNRNMVRAIGHVARGIWGEASVAAGLDATPASPLSLNFRVGPGMVTTLQSIDATAYGSLPVNNDQTVKVGSIDTTTTFPVVAPTTAGRSVKYLVQAAYDQQDTDNKVLPYRNAANPAQPYAGPANSGTAQPTVRRETVALQAKRGTEAVTGSEAIPAVSAGYVPLWVITVAYGQTTITAANIVSHADAPWTSKLTDKFAKIDSPLFTGTPRGPAPTTNDGLATKAYVDAILSGAGVSVAADPNTIAKRNGAGALVATSFIGKATSAGTADTATNATDAQNAVNAQNAQNAANAQNAVNAQNATTAQTAVSAGSATTATTATNAANAAKLDNKNASVATAADTVVVRDAGGNVNGNVFNGRASSASYADFAERFEASEPLEPGDVVMFGGDKEICKAGMAGFVFGVVSTDPAYLANADAGSNETHPPVAWQGRVPVKVLGPVAKFDVLVMSTIPGVAFAVKDHGSYGNHFARALEGKTGEGVDLVIAAVKARV